MRLIDWDDFIKGGTGSDAPVSMSIGVFDGIHIGHQKLLRRIGDFTAEIEGSERAVFTFTNNPSSVFHPNKFLGNLMTLDQKRNRFEAMNIEYVILIDFSADFSKLTGSDFLHIITEHLQVRYLCIGKNFHCGRNNDTNSARIKAILENNTVEVEIVNQVYYKNSPVSSTRIREEVLQGKVAEAGEMLGRPYELELQHGKNINQIIPKDGLYEVIIGKEQKRERRKEIEKKKLEINKKSMLLAQDKLKANQIETIQFIKNISKGE